MSHRASLARCRPSVTVILASLAAAVLASCSANLQSSNPSPSDALSSLTSAERFERVESANSLDASEGEEAFSTSSESIETPSVSEALPETDTSPENHTSLENHTSPETDDRAWRLVQNRGRLRVGLDPTIGYAYLRADTERRTFEGFEWDILQAIAQELDIDIEPIYIPWDNQLAALDTNSVDVILGGRDALGVDETRYTPTIPYYSSPQRIVVREEFSTEIQHLSDLFGRKVGTVADSAAAAVVEVFNQERANALTLLSSPNPSQLFEQLRESQVDAVVIDQPVAVAEADIVETISLEGGGSTSGDDARSVAEGESSINSPSGAGDTATALDADIGLDVIESLTVEPVVSSPSQPEEPMDGEASSEESAQESEETGAEGVDEDTTPDVGLYIVGEPMFPTPLVGVVKTEEASIKQAIDEAIVALEQNGTLTTILEKWDL
ncbi:MAG: substrate-binding periplasmic protein [Synechococcus sp.]